jgi:hypothetical protein
MGHNVGVRKELLEGVISSLMMKKKICLVMEKVCPKSRSVS